MPEEATYTDPPGMPADVRMTPAEFRVIRKWLGLDGEWLARMLGVEGRSVRRWEAGTQRIPDGVRLELERLEAVTEEAVASAVAQLMDEPDPVVVTYRTDAEYREAHPGADDGLHLPASWHWALLGRVMQEVPGLAITYRDEG